MAKIACRLNSNHVTTGNPKEAPSFSIYTHSKSTRKPPSFTTESQSLAGNSNLLDYFSRKPPWHNSPRGGGGGGQK